MRLNCCLWVMLSLFVWTTEAFSVLSEAFPPSVDRAAGELIGAVAGPDSAAIFQALDAEEKGVFLEQFWGSHNPLILKYYYGFYLGKRSYSVSDAFFERDDMIPSRFRTGAIEPDSALISQGLALCARARAQLPDDPVVLCALGYLRLEQGEAFEAEALFQRACELNHRFVEARNGRALAVLATPMRKKRALDLFRETVSLKPDYEAAVYNLAMCHLAMESIDLNHQFGRVIRKFPNHYDAYYKQGVFYESLHYFDKAMDAYSKQLVANPVHERAQGRLAKVTMELKWSRKDIHTLPELEGLAEKDPMRYLPLLAAKCLEEKEYGKSEATYGRYLNLLDPEQVALYNDVRVIASKNEADMLQMVSGKERRYFLKRFWLLRDPTPTTQVNERRLEHYRRVYYARANFSEGMAPWDRRGEVYIQFGHPDHRSWSDHLVFETKAKVVRVKNRLNDLAAELLDEVLPPDVMHGAYTSSPLFASGGVRGLPVFPLPHRGTVMRDGASLFSKWESWIYGEVGGGIEIVFTDLMGNYRYDFAEVPADSPNRLFWESLAPENVVARIRIRTPSVYDYDFRGDPMGLYISSAVFQASGEMSALETYIGVPWQDLRVIQHGEEVCARLERKVVIYDSTGTLVFQDSVLTEECIDQVPEGSGTLIVDQVRARLLPGSYFVAVRVKDPGGGKVQIYKDHVQVEKYDRPWLMMSDLEVAGIIEAHGNHVQSKFGKGDLEVVPMPSRTFLPEQPVYLYYEVYNLERDEMGQTHYRVDYTIRGAQRNAGARLLKGLGHLLGVEAQSEGVRVSYEHRGSTAWEPVYVALDVAPSGPDQLEVEVTVTDLGDTLKRQARKKVTFAIGK